ncbi:hypothetical protein CUMW_146270, partial [Citrus unshiu]
FNVVGLKWQLNSNQFSCMGWAICSTYNCACIALNPVVARVDQDKSVVWSANLSKEVRTPVVLQLLDSGNLVLRGERDGGSETYLWQSFDYPSDTLLPGMKLGWDLKTGLERRITSWKSPDDPSPGNFIWAVERQDNPELIMWKGSRKFQRSGPWNGLQFSASPLRPNPIFNFSLVSNEDELCYTFDMRDKAAFSRIVMNQTLYLLQRFIWNKATQSWELYSYLPRDLCDTYALCGACGVCIINDLPVCHCLNGFKPKSRGYVDWSQGCVRDKSLNYSRQDGFIKFTAMKLPDATPSRVSKSMNLNECREKCLENSSCMAYTNSDIRGGGSGCAVWFGELIDMRDFPDAGQDLYIRMSASEIEYADQGAKGKPTTKIVVIVVPTAALLAAVLIAGYLIHKSRRNIVEKTENNRETDQVQNMDLELPLFELATIANATSNFSINNKLGEGGFGPVYKGTLVDGQEIAVKRLSKISEQGLKELKNEVILFSKLQHRNLVKLLGCCIQGEEKLLIYEFMPNKSLNSFIFENFAWKLWNEGMPSQLIDPCIQGSFNLAEVIRCIHIGLLCVQQHPKDRPSMPSVILMLGSETVLPQPKQPGYLADRKSTRQDYSSSTPESCSTNTFTISEFEGR